MPLNYHRLNLLGRPFSPLYGLLMQIRSWLYGRRIFPVKKMNVPVISVGNLSMGGTGKTPIVRFIAELLIEKNYKPAIVSRGYGGKAHGKVNVVSDGKTIFLDAMQAGDEPRLLAQALPGIPVITGANRFFPCQYAVEKLGCTILILDDGFQHLSIDRDIDLVLFNANTLSDEQRVFPGGELREPYSALNRADAFLLTGMQQTRQHPVGQMYNFLSRNYPNRKIFCSSYLPSNVIDAKTLSTVRTAEIPLPVYGFCGIAKPMRFKKTLENYGIQLSGFSGLKDHQPYSCGIISFIEDAAKRTGAKAIITTEKDSVKLHEISLSLPLLVLSMKVEIEASFSDYLLGELAFYKNNF